MKEDMVERFFAYARERQMIKIRRDLGQPKPWTSDTILNSFRFCNVFREDDKVTQWLRTNVRDPLRASPVVIPAVITCRFFNRIESMELLVKHNLHVEWNVAKLQRVFKGVKPIVGAAYIIKTPNGMDKLRGIISILDEVWTSYYQLIGIVNAVRACPTMEKLVSYLTTFPYIGKFTAYEIACDLQYTDFFKPRDTMSWANPGPGAQRGLQRIMNGAVGGGKLYDSVMLAAMQELLRLSQQMHYWSHDRNWDMRTVEHTLCEWDKYERTRLGEGTPKQKYNGR